MLSSNHLYLFMYKIITRKVGNIDRQLMGMLLGQCRVHCLSIKTLQVLHYQCSDVYAEELGFNAYVLE